MRGIKNYNNKMRSLAMMQTIYDPIEGFNCVCGISKKTIRPVEYGGSWYDGIRGVVEGKLDFCHIVSRTDQNIKKYPHFIDSLLNGVIGLHSMHLASNQPNYPYSISDVEAEQYELFLDSSREYKKKGVTKEMREMINEILNCERINDLHIIQNAVTIIKAFVGGIYG